MNPNPESENRGRIGNSDSESCDSESTRNHEWSYKSVGIHEDGCEFVPNESFLLKDQAALGPNWHRLSKPSWGTNTPTGAPEAAWSEMENPSACDMKNNGVTRFVRFHYHTPDIVMEICPILKNRGKIVCPYDSSSAAVLVL